MKNTRRTRVSLVEDDDEMCKRLSASIRGKDWLELIATYRTGAAALADLAAHAPDVLLVDLGLPDMSGLEVVRFTAARHPACDVLVISVFDDEASVLAALGAGARGYLAAPLLVLCLRVVGRRSPAIESGIWLFTLCGAAVMPLAGEALQSRIITLWSVTYLVALAVLLVFLGVRAGERDVSFRILIAGIALAAVLNFFDLGRWMGWLDYDNLTLTHFHVPLLLFAIGAMIADRHFRAVAAVEHAKVELEHRVTETTREIASSYQRLREADFERARALERNRIMADMHDGVGSSLLSLIGMIHSGKTGRAAIERRAQEALLELRLAVDSLGPVDGDLGVVLGNVRHRMREAIENSSARFQWHVGELPRIDHLTPHGVLAIQRMLLEAITNALEHAQAKTITVRTDVDHAGRTLVIEAIDDGIGFDPAAVVRGRGLDSLYARARAVGASVDIGSATGRGTRLSFTLPILPFEA